MTGMFSLLGVLFGMPLTDLLLPLSLSDEVQSALLAYQGELGAMLRLSEAAERNDAGAASMELALLQVPVAEFNQACAAAADWMLDALLGSRDGDA